MAVKHAFTSAKSDGADATLVRPSNWNADHTAEGALEFVIDGAGSTITTGVKFDLELPYSGTIASWTLLADQAGAIVVDLWKDTYANFPPTDADSITSATPPTIPATNAKATNATLTGWTKTFTKGQILRVNVDSATTITRCTLSLAITEP